MKPSLRGFPNQAKLESPCQDMKPGPTVCMDLQPYTHYCFSKILRFLFDFLNNTYWVSLFQRNNLLIFWTGVSCFSVTLFYSTLFCCGGKAYLVRFTLFYSTLLTLTDGRIDGRRNEYTRFTWAGGTFFPVVLLCQFLFWREIDFGFTYYYVLRVSYSCGVVFVFLVLAGNSFWCYVHTQSIIQLCGCVIFFCGGKVNFVRIFLFNPNFLLFYFWQETVFGVTYVLSVQYSCAVVSVFLVWQES